MDPHPELQPTENDAPGETPEPPQRMTKRQILTLISIASVNFSSMICYSILGPFFPNEAVKKGASQTVIGLIFGCYAICNLLGALILGKYIVQIGAKFMLVMGLFVSSVCTILFGLLNRVPAGAAFISLCFIVRSVDAVGFAAAMTSSFAMTAKIFPNNVATVLGSLEIFTGLGLIMGPPVGGWFYQSFGYEVPFMLLGCFLLVMVPFNIYVLPVIEAEPSKDSFLRLLMKTKIVLLCYVIFTLSAGLGYLDATLSLFAIDTFGLSPGYVGLIMLGLSLPYCLASPLLGYFTDKYPVTRSWFMVIGGTATGIGFWFLGPAPFFNISSHLWLLVLMLAIIGFSLGMTAIPTFPEIITCAYDLGYEEGLSTLGMVSGLFGAFWSLGMFYGPIVGGLITQNLNFQWAAVVQGSLAFLGAFFLAVCYFYQQPQERSDRRATGDRQPDETDETTALLSAG
ncbi:MFS-type transporter SLC18B1-like [Takifugu rubripes]|uniref:MFS-type transporter SLC18B1-like n=1 Tax=Takifugu rubripes TaxID=31033 RepID=UPI001145AFFE|nr:MFS-type transporter SLC18B1-like [Takifugu rubripes]XP_029685716.1 MFS-type transporter SLC18B1-like [Takifugu rubripes]XP_029685720.1 MFS-type transporter SLC18B1-like [Takifugu rubripes]